MWCAEKSSSNYRKYNSGRNALIAGGALYLRSFISQLTKDIQGKVDFIWSS
jgi:hypothetical protein